MPALFAPAGGDEGFTPLAQLGAGRDGICILARRGDRLVEVHQLSFAVGSLRWQVLETRVRAIAAIDQPAVRSVLALDHGSAVEPPTCVIEGDSFPPIAELIEQSSVDLVRGLRIGVELARALAASHHIGVFHGGLHPWSIWVGPNDRPRFELTHLATRTTHHPWATRCLAPEANDGPIDSAADVVALGQLLGLFATTAGRIADEHLLSIVRDMTAPDPEARPTINEVVRLLHTAAVGARGRPTLQDEEENRPLRPGLGVKIGRFELTRQLGAGAMG